MFAFALVCVCVCVFAFAQEKHTPLRRILGGEVAEITNFPHAAFFFHKATHKMGHIFAVGCGSVIITARLVITAAHCLDHNTITMQLYVGESSKYQGQIYEVEKSEIHKKYYRNEFINDIGILLTKGTIQFGTSVKPARVKKTYTSFEMATIAGWGKIDEDTFPLKLRFLPVPFIPSDECGELLDLENQMEGIICAGYGVSYKATAEGDSGSGLMVEGKTVVGLLNGDHYDEPNIDIYANVTYYYQWIQSRAKKFGVAFSP